MPLPFWPRRALRCRQQSQWRWTSSSQTNNLHGMVDVFGDHRWVFYVPYDSKKPPPFPEAIEPVHRAKKDKLDHIFGCGANSQHVNWKVHRYQGKRKEPTQPFALRSNGLCSILNDLQMTFSSNHNQTCLCISGKIELIWIETRTTRIKRASENWKWNFWLSRIIHHFWQTD